METPFLGCTSINYVEYNPLANVDDGSCQTAINNLYLYYLIDSLSNQLQNIQESLITNTIEESGSDAILLMSLIHYHIMGNLK